MPNVFKQIKPEANLSRNPFDKASRNSFTAKGGMCIPVFHMETVPNDTVKIQPYFGCQTMPLLTNTFGRARVNIDYYFVRYNSIWANFNEFITTREDQTDSSHLGFVHTPCFDLDRVLQQFQADVYDYNRYHYYLSFRDLDADEQSALNSISDDFGNCYVHGSLRLLDMLDYGAYYSVIDFKAGTPKPDSTPENPKLYPVPVLPEFNQRPNLFALAAYQRIWSEFYRNRWWDTGNFSHCFNFNDIYCTTPANSDVYNTRSYSDIYSRDKSPFLLRYRSWKKDYFLGLYPDPQFGDVSTVAINMSVASTGSTGTDLDRWGRVDGSTGWPSGETVVASYPNTDFSLKLTESDRVRLKHDHLVSVSGTGNTSVSVYAIRQAEMIQKWKETLLRAGEKTKSLWKGIFGSEPYELDSAPHFIGSTDGDLQVNPIYSTANTASDVTTDSNLGDIAGRAQVNNLGSSKDFTFKTNDYGVIMGIMYIVPEAEYDALGMSRDHTRTEPAHFFNPMWMNLGFEAIYGHELRNVPLPLLGEPYSESFGTWQNKSLGFGPRYLAYKTSLDKVHGQLMSRGARYVNGTFNQSNGSLMPYNIPRADLELSMNGLSFKTMYINPSSLDNIFNVKADSTQDTDQFIFACYHKVNRVAPISILGLPKW